MKFDMSIDDNHASFIDKETGASVFVDSFDNINFYIRIGTLSKSINVSAIKASTSIELNYKISEIFTLFNREHNGKQCMKKSTLLTIITNPVGEDYLYEAFLQECEHLNNPQFSSNSAVSESVLEQLESKVSGEWQPWLKRYINMHSEGKLPSLWTISQYGLGFDFKENLDDFDADAEYFSLGSDPSGEWFVMSKSEGGDVYLCDHHTYGLYDGWLNPNHLMAWALRAVLADENDLTSAEVIEFWKSRSERVEKATIDRIAEDLS